MGCAFASRLTLTDDAGGALLYPRLPTFKD
jgi:hypothetical protein